VSRIKCSVRFLVFLHAYTGLGSYVAFGYVLSVLKQIPLCHWFNTKLCII